VPPAVETLALLGLAMALQEKIDKSSKYVIFDRYIDSIFAQVYARNNMKGRKLKAGPFYKWFSKVVSSVGIALPVKTFILDLPLEIASKRTVGREGKKYTKNDFGGFLKIREIYSFLQKREPKRIIWLDGCKRPEELTNEVMSWINK
jgi:thymidylate kinase